MNTRTSHAQRAWKLISVILQDIRRGLLEVSRQSLALLGLGVISLAVAVLTQPELQSTATRWLKDRLYGQWMALDDSDPLTNPSSLQLPPEQTQVTLWLSRKYKVSPRPLKPLVAEAWLLGRNSQLPATLILAVMAVESRFNPFAQGSQGGTGLMQITPAAHAESLERFGGQLAVFDPLTNLRLGARMLQAFVQDNGGSVTEGLRQYAEASGQPDRRLYAEQVLAEHHALERIRLQASEKAPASDTPHRP